MFEQTDEGVRLHLATLETIRRGEGYREFRCQPAWWSYAPEVEAVALRVELAQHLRGEDPHGLGIGSEMWSGSDAALRLLSTRPDRLDLRELHVLATRRLLGLNAPGPWIGDLVGSDSAPDRRGMPPWSGSMWQQLGMEEGTRAQAVSGWSIDMNRDPPHPPSLPAGGASGRWYRWSTIARWQGWPRGQDAAAEAIAENDGELRLFVSHRWETAVRPDPADQQRKTLLGGLAVALARAVELDDPERHFSVSGLPELLARHYRSRLGTGWRDDPDLQAWAKQVREVSLAAGDPAQLVALVDRMPGGGSELLSRLRDDVVIWYDFSSMFQAPRSTGEELDFRAEILELNEIQRGAVTVLLQPGEDYLSRGWCFLEFAGALREQFVELRAEPGTSIRNSSDRLLWAARTDQLIGALATVGHAAVNHAGLRVTHGEDLASIGTLLSQLPLLGAVWSDDSDIVGGALPFPRIGQGWVTEAGHSDVTPSTSRSVLPMPRAGELPPATALSPTSKTPAGSDSLDGGVGIWCFATTRSLSLAWAHRSAEIWACVRDDPRIAQLTSDSRVPAVAAAWTDAWNLADDGEGWTRAIPSTVRVLVVVTQAEVVAQCLIFQSILNSHLAAGGVAAVYQPFDGALSIYESELPSGTGAPDARKMDVLARPRTRRDACRLNQLFLNPELRPETLEVMAALRRDPRDGILTMEIVRDSVAAHPEWGFDPTLDSRELLAQLSLDDLRARAPELPNRD